MFNNLSQAELIALAPTMTKIMIPQIAVEIRDRAELLALLIEIDRDFDNGTLVKEKLERAIVLMGKP